MSDEQLLERISSNPRIMVGKPVIKGTRLTIEFILNLMAHGAQRDEILSEYKGLSPEDIHACCLFASQTDAASVGGRFFQPLRLPARVTRC